MSKRDFPPIHPGEILREEFLNPLGISQYRLAKEIHVPARRINEIVLEKRGISADTALRLLLAISVQRRSYGAIYKLGMILRWLGKPLRTSWKPKSNHWKERRRTAWRA